MATLDSLTVDLGINNRGFRRGIDESVADLNRFDRQVKRTSAQADTLSRSSGAIASGLKGVVSGLAAGLSAAAVGAGLSAAARSATEFGLAMAEVSTLLDDTSAIPGLTDKVKALAIEFGKAPVEEVRALYQIISAGATSAAQATAILTAANQLAVGGITDVKTAADGLTTIMNAYGPAAGAAADVSDALFVAMKAGKTTIAELSRAIGTVAPLASQAGVSLEETLAAASALTKGGLKTDVAMTGLRATLAGIIRPSEEAQKIAKRLGLDFSAAGLKAKGLGGFLEDLRVKTGGNTETLSKLVGGVEALTPVLALTGTQAKDFTALLEQMAQKAGETAEAFGKVAGTPAQQFAKLKAQLAVLAVDLGNKLLKVAVPAVETLNKHFTRLVDVLASVGKALALVTAGFLAFKVAAIGGVIAGTVGAFLALIPAVAGAADALTLAGFAARGFLAALGPIGIAAVAIGALATLFYKQSQAAREASRATDAYATSLQTLAKSQLINLSASLIKQIDELRAQRAAIERLSAVAVSDATGTGRRATRGTAREIGEITRLDAEIAALETRLTEAGRAFAGAFDDLTTGAADAGEATSDLGGHVDTAADAFKSMSDNIERVSSRLSALSQSGNQYTGWAADFRLALVDAQAELADLERRIADSRFVGAVDTALVGLANGLRDQIAKAADHAFDPLIDAANTALRRAQALAGPDLGTFIRGQLLEGLQAEYRNVVREIAAEGGPLKANITLLEKQRDLVREIATLRPEYAVDLKALDKVADKLGAITIAAAEAKLGIGRLEKTLKAIGDVAYGIGQIADALGGIGDQARKSINGVLQLVDSIQQIRDARDEAGNFDVLKALPGIFGAAAGGISLLSGIFGGGAGRERDRILQENTQRLRELRVGLKELDLVAGRRADVGRAAAQLSVNVDLRELVRKINAPVGSGSDQFARSVAAIDRALAPLGLTFLDLQEEADRLGITLVANGRILYDSFTQLAQGIGITIASLTRLSQDLDTLRTAGDLRARLEGTDSPVARVDREIALLGDYASRLGESFQGLDASTIEGRDALRRAALDLLTRAEAGFTRTDTSLKVPEIPDADILGKFGDADEVLAFLDNFASALDAIEDKITAFGNTLDEQRTRLDLRARLFGQDSPADALRRELDLLSTFAPELGRAFQGLDVVTDQGRAAIRTALQNLFLAIEEGLLSEEALGQLTGLGDLLGIIGNVDAALNGFADAADSATASLRNVPDGFKLALRRFESSFAEIRLPSTPLPTMTAPALPPPIFDPAPVSPTFSPPPIVDPAPLAPTFTFESGSIVIEGSERSGEQLLDEVTKAARLKSLAYYGTTTRAAEVL